MLMYAVVVWDTWDTVTYMSLHKTEESSIDASKKIRNTDTFKPIELDETTVIVPENNFVECQTWQSSTKVLTRVLLEVQD